MRHIARSALVPYTAQQMFDLVADIERYPQFMDGCVGAEILKQEGHFVEARLDIAKAKIAKSFITRNHLVPSARIDMSLVEGPFKTLEGAWEFQNLGEHGCKVSLHLRFEFKSSLVAIAANPWFESVANELVDAISQRANKIYATAKT